MKTKIFLMIALAVSTLFVSCKKDSQEPQMTFTNNQTEGKADANGEYNLTGRIVSEIALDKVTLTIEGQNTPFFVDESTAKNKNEYDFSYIITGITENVYVIVDVYDQEGGRTSMRFLIRP